MNDSCIQVTVSNLTFSSTSSNNNEDFILKAFFMNPMEENIPFFKRCRRKVYESPILKSRESNQISFEFQIPIDSVERSIHRECYSLIVPSLLICIYSIDDETKVKIHMGYVQVPINMHEITLRIDYKLPFLKPNGQSVLNETLELQFQLKSAVPEQIVRLYHENIRRIQNVTRRKTESVRNNIQKRSSSGDDLCSQVFRRHQHSSQRRYEQEQYRINCENARLQERLKNISLGKK